MQSIVFSAFDKGYSYSAYREHLAHLVIENRSSGTKQTEKLAEYTRLNLRRMKRWEKTLVLSEESLAFLTSLSTPMNWLVLTESWCGDAAHLIPIFHKLAAASPWIQLKMIWRDENPDIMDLYLTEGSRSIPKLIAYDPENKEELATWGPRPEEAQKMVRAHKLSPERPYSELQKDLQLWYNKNKGQQGQQEFLAALKMGMAL